MYSPYNSSISLCTTPPRLTPLHPAPNFTFSFKYYFIIILKKIYVCMEGIMHVCKFRYLQKPVTLGAPELKLQSVSSAVYH